MKTSARIGILSLLFASAGSNLFGCTYEAPTASSTDGAGGNATSSSSGSGGSSGQGGSGPCEPGTSKICMPYSGPVGTEGVKACVASTSECLMSGSWAPCSAEVVPTTETCLTGKDQDPNCDALVPCLGAPLRSNPFAGAQTSGNEFILALGAGNGSNGHDGPVYAVGGRNGSSLDPLDLMSPLLWQLDKDGTMHDWSNKFIFDNKIDPNGALATGVGVDPGTGDVIVTGLYVGGILTIDGKQFTEAGGLPNSFYTRFSSTGAVLNKRILNVGGMLTAQAMTLDSAGNAYIVGTYSGEPQIDQTKFLMAEKPHGFILAVKPDGSYLWHQTLDGTGSSETVAIANVDDAYLVIATRYAGNLSITTAMGANFPPDAGVEPDILVSRLKIDNGLASWNSVIVGSGSGGNLVVGGLAANSDHVVISGRYTNTITINGLPYTNADGMAAADSFLATLDMSTGSFAAHFPSVGVGLQDIRGVAIDAAGDVIITGAYSEQLTLLNIMFPTTTTVDTFVMKTNAYYQKKWLEPRIFGGMGEQRGQAVIVGKQAGNIYVGGAFVQEFAWPNASLKSAGSADAFLISLSN